MFVWAEIPEALYESGKSQLSVRVPKDPAQRFPAIVRAFPWFFTMSISPSVAFSSPWRTINMDVVEDITAQVAFAARVVLADRADGWQWS